jgi:Fis family transcriptional regulator, factor for inversion stimulation protein
MKKEELTSAHQSHLNGSDYQATEQPADLRNCNLRQAVDRVMQSYLKDLGDDDLVTDLYELVLSEVEAPLLEAVLRHTNSNQSRASTLLGLNRGTLRKKMKQYGLL